MSSCFKWLLVLYLLPYTGCHGQFSAAGNITTSFNMEDISSNNSEYSVNEQTQSSPVNLSLVSGLSSSLTTTSNNVSQGSSNSMDYPPLVMPTMSSAYSRLTDDGKSTESIRVERTWSNELAESTVSDNQFFKQSNANSNWIASSEASHSNVQDYNIISSTESQLLTSSPRTNTGTESRTLNMPPTIIVPSSDSIISTQNTELLFPSTVKDSHDFHANTGASYNSDFGSHRHLSPSEWRAGIFPSDTSERPMTYSTQQFYTSQEMILEASRSIIASSVLAQGYITSSYATDTFTHSSTLTSQTIQPSSVLVETELTSKYRSHIHVPRLYSGIVGSSSRRSSRQLSDLLETGSHSSSSEIMDEPILSSHSDLIHSTSRELTSEIIPSLSYPIVPSSSVLGTSSMQTSTIVPQATTPQMIVFKDVRFLFTFSGDCLLITNNTLYLAEFIEGLRKTIVEKLHITNDRIRPHDISCGSIKIYVTLKNMTYPTVVTTLSRIVNTRNFIVPTFIENQVVTFTAESVKEVELKLSDDDTLDFPDEEINDLDIIVIIVASCVCGILLIIGVVVCIRECYRRKHAQSFDLLDMPHVNLKLEDFTLTRIPRPKTNYNGGNARSQIQSNNTKEKEGKENGKPVTNGKHINLSDVHVRMKPLNEGIVVGVTGYSTPNGLRGKKRNASSSSQARSDDIDNPSMENLVTETEHSGIGASNPLFVDDDDQGSTSTLDISRAYHSE